MHGWVTWGASPKPLTLFSSHCCEDELRADTLALDGLHHQKIRRKQNSLQLQFNASKAWLMTLGGPHFLTHERVVPLSNRKASLPKFFFFFSWPTASHLEKIKKNWDLGQCNNLQTLGGLSLSSPQGRKLEFREENRYCIAFNWQTHKIFVVGLQMDG